MRGEMGSKGGEVTVPALKAKDPGSSPGPSKNISLKLLIYNLPDCYFES